jgi:Ku protein
LHSPPEEYEIPHRGHAFLPARRQHGFDLRRSGQVKGYEIGKGEHLIVEDDELAAIRIESSHTIDIDRFVPQAEVDERYLDTPYYLAPADRVAQEAFAVIREAMDDRSIFEKAVKAVISATGNGSRRAPLPFFVMPSTGITC